MEIKDLPPKMRAQAERKLENQKPQAKKKTKYNNIPITLGNIRFDSKKEAKRYIELKGLYDAGIISDLRLQHHFTLQGAFKTADGEMVNKIDYIADFTYWQNKCFVVEDVKSPATRKNPLYIAKKKLMADKGYIIREV